jgi:glucans biosynthesis protein
VNASAGIVRNVVIHRNPATGGLRISFQLDPQNETLIEMRATLTFEVEGAVGETWVYRWTA